MRRAMTLKATKPLVGGVLVEFKLTTLKDRCIVPNKASILQS
jgi:hypothetical protein